MSVVSSTELKKALYKEKPVAKQTGLYRDGGSKDYEAETTLGIVKFHVPIRDQQASEEGPALFAKEMPAQLLIRWMIN